MEQISRLSPIEHITIADNHNFAKKSGVGSELEKLEFLNNVHASYEGKYEKVYYDDLNIIVHALPSGINRESFKKEFDKITREDGYFNILLSHCGVTDIEYYEKIGRASCRDREWK